MSVWMWLFIICIAAPIALVGLSIGIGVLWVVLSIICDDIASTRYWRKRLR